MPDPSLEMEWGNYSGLQKVWAEEFLSNYSLKIDLLINVTIAVYPKILIFAVYFFLNAWMFVFYSWTDTLFIPFYSVCTWYYEKHEILSLGNTKNTSHWTNMMHKIQYNNPKDSLLTCFQEAKAINEISIFYKSPGIYLQCKCRRLHVWYPTTKH